jgi:hypothetical protein
MINDNPVISINLLYRKCEKTFRFEGQKYEYGNKLFSAETYAPAIPGVVVALFVLFVSNFISGRRERRKELLSLCDNIEELIDAAVEAVSDAWVSQKEDRVSKVAVAKRKLQMLGSNITELSRRSGRTVAGFQLFKSIECLEEMSDFHLAPIR